MKECVSCSKIKNLDEFPKRSDSPDGHRNTCKVCRLEYQRKWHSGQIVKTEYADSETQKQCRNCSSILDRSCFGKSAYTKDGLKSKCNTCKREESKQWREQNPDYYSNYHKVNCAELAIKAAERREKNKDAIKIEKAKYYKNNRPLILLNKQIWYRNNKDKALALKHRRRDMEANCDHDYCAADKRTTLAAFENKCYRCGAQENLQIDHHRPLIKGFGLSLENAVVLCKSCNLSKGKKDPEEFYGPVVCLELDSKLAKLAQVNKENQGVKNG